MPIIRHCIFSNVCFLQTAACGLFESAACTVPAEVRISTRGSTGKEKEEEKEEQEEEEEEEEEEASASAQILLQLLQLRPLQSNGSYFPLLWTFKFSSECGFYVI